MTHSPSEIYLVDTADALAELAPGLGKLTVTVVQDLAAAPFEVLDTFDGSVRDLGAVLISVADQYRLVTADGASLEQNALRAGAFVDMLAPGPVRDALADLSPLRSLQPVGRGSVHLQRCALTDDEGKTQVRLELQNLSPDQGDTGLTVIAVQALRGYDKAYRRVCDALQSSAVSAPVSARTLSQRLCPTFQPHSAKPNVPLSPSDTAFDAACDLINAHIPVARATEHGVIADFDTEYLHDYRVALRKIRSVLSLFKGVFSEAQTTELKATFSDLMAPTGRLRDLDVYLLEKDLYFSMVPDTLHPGLTEMFRLFEAERKTAQRALSKRLRSAAYKKNMTALEAMFADPSGLDRGADAELAAFDYGCRLIWKRYRKVCKIAAAIQDDTPDEEVHELRIHCKKLRYLMEFFAPFFPKEDIKDLIKALKRLQDNLGLFNDYSVQQDSLRAFLGTHSGANRATHTEVAQSIGALIAILHRRQAEEKAKVVASFARFDSPQVQDAFRHLFKQQGQSS